MAALASTGNGHVWASLSFWLLELLLVDRAVPVGSGAALVSDEAASVGCPASDSFSSLGAWTSSCLGICPTGIPPFGVADAGRLANPYAGGRTCRPHHHSDRTDEPVSISL